MAESQPAVGKRRKVRGTSDSAPRPFTGKRPAVRKEWNQALPVAVVGGGIGGLACALALEKRGIPVVVYERDASFAQRRQGYGMTMSTTNTALEELGILSELRQRDTVSESHYVFASDGAVLGYFGTAFASNSSSAAGSDRGNLRVPRQVLRKMLLDRLTPGTVRWGKQLVSYQDDAEAESVLVSFTDGTTARSCALVGAEGIRSIIRRCKTGDELQYLGVMAVVGITPMQHPLLARRGFYTLDGQARLFTMPFADGVDDSPATTMWQLTFRADEAEAIQLAAMPKHDLITWLLKRCNGWHSPVSEMMTVTPVDEVWAHPLYDRDPMAPPKKGNKSRVTVLGDVSS